MKNQSKTTNSFEKNVKSLFSSLFFTLGYIVRIYTPTKRALEVNRWSRLLKARKIKRRVVNQQSVTEVIACKTSDNGISRICSRDFLVLDQFYQCLPHLIMRQLPGKASKETRRMKRERKKGNSEGHQKMLTIALPVFLGLFVLLVAYVYTTASKH